MQLDGQPGAADLVDKRAESVEAGLGRRARPRRPSRRIAARRRRISVSAVRPACSTPLSASRVFGERVGQLILTAPTWSTMTLTACATMSWSSRAIRARSSATAIARRRVSLALGLRRAHLSCFGLLGALAQRVACDPADRVPEREEDRFAADSAEWRRPQAVDPATGRQADARLLIVAQVPEEKRGCEPSEDQAVAYGVSASRRM